MSVPYPGHDVAEAPATATAGPTARTFSMECQRAFLWCWAAATVSVTRFYDAQTALKQCTLATTVLSASDPTVTDCCKGSDRCMAGDRPRRCDAMSTAREALLLVGHLRQRHIGPIPLTAAAGAVSIQDEVDSGRPIVCRVKWEGRFGHIVVIHDYVLEGEEPRVLVADPENGESIYATSSLEHGFRNGAGKWTHTYTTRQREEENVDPTS